ncbi:MAG: L-2-hydroxyglutarate oxidase [Nitrospinaceae bacterium]|nr:L-2-hydroxyglutarate oxidase [Nitrospinaceae bacterium]
MNNTDFLIIGGGVIGLSIARVLKKRFSDSRVTLIEKEKGLGFHGSGRNSGVLHAGFYYSSDSLKAKFTRTGNQRLTEYCESRGLKINKCGKLVVAKNEEELQRFNELLERGKKNGVPLQCLTKAEAREIEPRVKTFEKALYSPSTATIDPLEVIIAMQKDAEDEGVDIHLGTGYLQAQGNRVSTSSGSYEARMVINAGGLYADKIAMDFGFSRKYRILPFKGLYLNSDEPPGSLKTNIYPVPNLKNPFLGTHLTVTVTGKTKIGPTAMPALWREQYQGMKNLCWSEVLEILARQCGLFISSNFNFKALAFEEIRKRSRPHLVALASSLAEGVELNNYRTWGKPGIRAQLINIEERKLEMDFVIEGDQDSIHVLNAVSPAFTCALPFAEYVCDQVARHVS